MRKLFVAALLVASFAFFAQAQSDDSRAEFFAGYSLLRTDVTTEDFRSPIATSDEPLKNLQGFNVAATGYLTEKFGLTGDFSAHFKSDSFGGVLPIVCIQAPCPNGTFTTDAKARSFNILGGPQVRFANSTRVTPFVRALAGVQHNRLEANSAFSIGGGSRFEDSRTDFALGVGGGLDVRLSDRFALRAFQIDYNPVFERDRDVTFNGATTRVEGGRTDNVRFSVGVVFK